MGLMKTPDVDLSLCSMCGICVDLCPMTFKINDAGYIEVIHPCGDPEEDINEAIRDCRSDCISWKESE
jgi:ferredoxin